MTLQEFYDKLERHDWFYEYSDDHSVYKRGQAAHSDLQGFALRSGQQYQQLFDAYKAYVNKQGEKPARPE